MKGILKVVFPPRQDETDGNSDSYTPIVYPASKLKQAISQILAAFAGSYFLFLTVGSATQFLKILQKTQNNNILFDFMSAYYNRWILRPILVTLGCLCSCLLTGCIGPKMTILFTNMLLMSSWMIFSFATTIPAIHIAHAIMIVGSVLSMAPAITYVVEISQPHLRGILSASTILAYIIGALTQTFISEFVDWITLSRINLVYPSIGCILLCFNPESPYWLAGLDDTTNAEKSLQWLRGWTSELYVHEEFQMIYLMVNTASDLKNILKKSLWRQNVRKFILPFIPIIIGFFIVSSQESILNMEMQRIHIYDMIYDPLDYVTLLLSLCGISVCIVLVHFTGRRLLNLVSIVILLISYLTLLIGVDDSQKVTNENFEKILQGIISFMMIIQVFPVIFLCETLPVSMWAVLAGVGFISFYFSQFIVMMILNFFWYIGFSLFSILISFLIIMTIGIILLYFFLPETEGRTLKDIKDQYLQSR